MKKLILLAICFSFNAEAVTVSNSCITSCAASCEAPKKAVKKPVKKKGKKRAKKIPKKAITQPIIEKQEAEPTKCEPVTEYVYLSELGDGWGRGLPMPSLPVEANDNEQVDGIRRSANNVALGGFGGGWQPPIVGNPQYVVSQIAPVAPPVNSVPLPATAWLFMSGLALVAGRKLK